MADPDNTDPYGIDLLLTADGDLAVTPGGGVARVYGADNCVQALQARVRTYPGELPLHLDYGSAAAAASIGRKAGDDRLLAAAARIESQRILEADMRFLAVRELRATSDPQDPTRALITMNLELAGGERLVISDLAEARVDEVDPGSTTSFNLDEVSADLDGDEAALLDGVDYTSDDLGEPIDFQIAAGLVDATDPGSGPIH